MSSSDLQTVTTMLMTTFELSRSEFPLSALEDRKLRRNVSGKEWDRAVRDYAAAEDPAEATERRICLVQYLILKIK